MNSNKVGNHVEAWLEDMWTYFEDWRCLYVHERLDRYEEITKWEQCVHQSHSSIWLPGAQVVQRLALARAHQCEGRSHSFCISPLSLLINWVTKMPVECIMQDPHHQHTQSFLNSFLFFLWGCLSPSLSLAVSCLLRMCTSSLFAYTWYSWQAR